jgi:hypothetical protein
MGIDRQPLLSAITIGAVVQPENGSSVTPAKAKGQSIAHGTEPLSGFRPAPE